MLSEKQKQQITQLLINRGFEPYNIRFIKNDDFELIIIISGIISISYNFVFKEVFDCLTGHSFSSYKPDWISSISKWVEMRENVIPLIDKIIKKYDN